MRYIDVFEDYSDKYGYDIEYVEECFVDMVHRPFYYDSYCRLFFDKGKKPKDLKEYTIYYSNLANITSLAIECLEKLSLKYPKVEYDISDDYRTLGLNIYFYGKSQQENEDIEDLGLF